jgi:uncharacterized protein with von Willebrand factor type A (vWA) domain
MILPVSKELAGSPGQTRVGGSADLVVHLARFAGCLRAAGIRVTTGDQLDALHALVRADLADPDEVRLALRCTLKIRPRDAAAFEELFARLWRDSGKASRPPPPRAEHGPGTPGARPGPGGRPAVEVEREAPRGDEPGWSRDAHLRRKPLEEWDDRDLTRMERLVARLARQLATRRSRRLVPVHGRGRPDPRRSLRRAVATAGEPVWLARRERPVETPRLVLICDTSGSMDPHARFLLAFGSALKRVAQRTEVFALNTELVRITPWLSGGRQRPALERLAAAVPDWSGGTRIGECLEAFVERHLDERVDSRTVVVILSDGLDRGEPERLAAAMERIQARARRVLWLNPLLADPRYQPIARGMAAALPFVDALLPVHDLESLQQLLRYLTTGAAPPPSPRS